MQKNIVEPRKRGCKCNLSFQARGKRKHSNRTGRETVAMVTKSIPDGCEGDIAKIQFMWKDSACSVYHPCSMVIALTQDHLSDADGFCTFSFTGTERLRSQLSIGGERVTLGEKRSELT